MKPHIIEAPFCKECEDRPMMILMDKKVGDGFMYACPNGHEREYRLKFPIQTKNMGKDWESVIEN